ncbi:MAG: DUF2075 domain-containing protein [Lentimicrobiaceae bacterium]|nr:DUF2075 domain-containing protein [Lentimicrobiaceae bacterium]
MIVYASSKSRFIHDVVNDDIQTIIQYAFEDKLKRKTSPAEIESWRDSLMYMQVLLTDDQIPQDAGILVEFMIPQSSFRVDFIITGRDEQDKMKVIIIELKRWTQAEATEKDGIVKTRFRGGVAETSHPSYQAWSYAAFMYSYNETIYTEDISLHPCAYLHNYQDDNTLTSPFYQTYLDRAPLFFKSDKQKLRDFIRQHIKKGDDREIMYRIENGRIKPSKILADTLVSMLKGNQEFIMLDDQKVVYEAALSGAKKASEQGKHVLIVEGGPGTGKSVVAINLLVNLTNKEMVAKYVTKNAAPRTVYRSMLAGNLKGGDISFMFDSSGSFHRCEPNTFDALVVDEAHRLNEKSGLFNNLGENQIKEIIEAAKFSVFFIDEDQKVTTKDIGSKEEIRRWAKHYGANVREMELQSQFRCNGSNGYLAWLDNTLQIRETAHILLDPREFEFIIMDNPAEMRDRIYELNRHSNRSRMLAGYCWDWESKKNRHAYDIAFPEFGFMHQWNLSKDGMNWIISPDSVKEIGCIHTSQGLELEHVGVIVGRDLVAREGRIVTDFSARARTDKSLAGIPGLAKKDIARAQALAGKLIKNTYRTLMTRGMKSCLVYFVDDETREYFEGRVG